jgi:hypothetical protein
VSKLASSSTHSAEHFSKEYLNKSRSWYAVQTHMQRDFSRSAAIECLRRIRTVQISHEPKHKEQETALVNLENLLNNYLGLN